VEWFDEVTKGKAPQGLNDSSHSLSWTLISGTA
jgi:hypothetical protein